MTKGNSSDIKIIKSLSVGLFGKLFGDKEYINQTLFTKLFKKRLKIVTLLKANMKGNLMNYVDKVILRKKSLIESTFYILKEILHIDHTRHRSPINCITNLLAGLAAYCLYDGKPNMRIDFTFQNIH